MHSNLLSTIPYAEWSSTYCVTVHIDGDTHPPKLLTSVILSEAKDLPLGRDPSLRMTDKMAYGVAPFPCRCQARAPPPHEA